MNPFDEREVSTNIMEREADGLQPLPFTPPFGGMTLEEQPSKVEKFIDKASGSLSRILKFIFLLAGILAVFALFRPYLHFLDELEQWTYTAIDFIFY